MGLDPCKTARILAFAPALYQAFRGPEDPSWVNLSQDKANEWTQYASRVLFDLEASAEAPA